MKVVVDILAPSRVAPCWLALSDSNRATLVNSQMPPPSWLSATLMPVRAKLVLKSGIEPLTRGFSNHRSTSELQQHVPILV